MADSWPRRAFLAAVFVLLGACLLKKIVDYDIWYHLVVGREVARAWRVPGVEFYVYPLLGSPAHFFEYGFGLLFFETHRLLGYGGMSVLNAVLAATTLFVLYRTAAIRQEESPGPLLLLVPLLWLTNGRMVYRPEVCLYLALAAEIYALERHAAGGSSRWLAAVPALTFLLASLHPSSLILLMVLALYLAQGLVSEPRTLRAALLRLRDFGVAGAAGVLASAVNPHGFEPLVLPLKFATEERLLSATLEFQPTMGTSQAPILLLLCAIAIPAVLVPKGRRVVGAGMVLLFGFLAFRHVRNIALLALVTYVPVARALDAVLRRIPRLVDRPGRIAGRAGALALLGLALVVTARSPAWGWGVAEERFPVRSAALIAASKPPGRIVNYPHMGGYLAWRLYDDYLVATDGRHYLGWDASLALVDDVFGAGERWQDLVRQHEVTMVVSPGVIEGSGWVVPLLVVLDADEGWSLVQEEPAALLLMRTEVARQAGIPILSKDLIWEHVLADARRMLPGDRITGPRLALSVGMALLELRLFEDSEPWLSHFLQATPDDAWAQRMLALVRATRQGDPEARLVLENMYGRADPR